MNNGTYPNNSALDFTTNRNIIWISAYIRRHFYVTNYYNIIPSEIIVLINQFYLTQLYLPFGDLILYEEIVKGLYNINIHKPLESLQQRSILSILNGDNITTKGKSYQYDKTTTIAITQLQNVNLTLNTCQILTISSSRESAQYLYQNTHNIAKHLPIKHELCIGGTTISQDIEQISDDVQIMHGVVARIYSLIQKNALNLDAIKLLILDDADMLLDKGFKEQLDEIITHLPATIQIAIFCSTISNDIIEFEQKHIHNSIHIDVKQNCDTLSLKNMKQYYVPVVQEQNKLIELLDILESFVMTKCIIYCNSKEKIVWLYEQITQCDFTVAMLHMDMNKNQFVDSVNEFINGNTYILVSMDLNTIHLNNDMDICELKRVALVINYDLAIDKQSYLLRNGSYQKKGIAIHFVCNNQLPISDLERQHSTQMDELPLKIESILN